MTRFNIFIIVSLVLIISCVSEQAEEVWNVTPEKVSV